MKSFREPSFASGLKSSTNNIVATCNYIKRTPGAVEAPVCHGQMRAVAVERPLPKRAPCCLGRKRG